MGPKRSDNTNRGRRPSQTGVNTEDQGWFFLNISLFDPKSF